MSDLVLARNCCLARMLPGEAENGVGMNSLSGKAKSVKRFERSNGLDTALYKNYLYLFTVILTGVEKKVKPAPAHASLCCHCWSV